MAVIRQTDFPAPTAIRATGNPILADGCYCSTDPARIVDRDTLWILAGRDEAPPRSTTSS